MVDYIASVVHLRGDATITIPTFMFMEYDPYQFFIACVFITGLHTLEMIVENRASHRS